ARACGWRRPGARGRCPTRVLRYAHASSPSSPALFRGGRNGWGDRWCGRGLRYEQEQPHHHQRAAADRPAAALRRGEDGRRRSDHKPGPPLAVKKLVAGAAWPMAFSVDGRDAMFPGTQLAGKVTVNVRVDKDGDAITKNPGDVTGTAAIVPPADKLVVTLDTV